MEYAEGMVTIHAGKGAARLQHTQGITFPVDVIEAVEFRSANPLVNGSMRFRLVDMSIPVLQSYGADQPNRVNTQSFIVHWRRKDGAAFAAVRDTIEDARAGRPQG